MNEAIAKRLHDTLAACNELQRIGQRHSRDEFLDDYILQLAVWKLVEIVGEALRQAERLDPTVAGDIPELRRIVDTRNRITHGYDSVDSNLLGTL
jgi:uncharacterized protein with HEPN domain